MEKWRSGGTFCEFSFRLRVRHEEAGTCDLVLCTEKEDHEKGDDALCLGCGEEIAEAHAETVGDAGEGRGPAAVRVETAFEVQQGLVAHPRRLGEGVGAETEGLAEASHLATEAAVESGDVFIRRVRQKVGIHDPQIRESGRKGGVLTTFFRGGRRFCGGRVFDRVESETEPCWVGEESGIAGMGGTGYNERHDHAMIPPDFSYGPPAERKRSVVREGDSWHTTGSAKTLTSFKAATRLNDDPDIEKCLFVVDHMVALPGQLFGIKCERFLWN